MIKNQSNIYRFPMEDYLGKGVTGLAPTVKLSKDGGTFAAATNSVTEPDTTNAPGLYQLILTAEECNCNLLTLVVNVPTGEWGAILTEFDMQSPSDTSGLATAEALSAVATNVSAVKAKTDTLPEHPAAVGSEMALTSAAIAAAQSGLATSDALSTVDSVVDAIKAKTDNLPQSPAAIGSAMTLTSETVTSIKNGLATSDGLSSLASHGDTYWVTADISGLATGGGLEALASYGDNHWTTADVSDLAKTSDVSSAQTALTALINSVLSGIFHWQVEGSILTIYNASNVAIGAYTLTKDNTGNITAVTPIVQQTNNSEE